MTSMSEQQDRFTVARWTKNFEELDREIGRLALLCRVRILDAGVIGRVLKNDASVCGADNAAAFAKLRDLLMMHLVMREISASEVGHLYTAAIEGHVVTQLRTSFPDLLGHWPPA